jgi:uncharacterized protein
MKSIKYILRNRIWFIVLPFVAIVFAGMLLTRIKINPDLESYFPDKLPSKINMRLIENHFGKKEPLLMLVEADDILQAETLQRLEKISADLSGSSAVADVVSLFEAKSITGTDGFMVVEPAVNFIPTNESEKETLRQQITHNELVYKTLISDDFNYSLIIVYGAEGIADDELIGAVKTVISENPGAEKMYLTGLPYLRLESNNKITRDLLILLPLGLLVMIIFLYLSFREMRGVWLPFGVVVFSIVVSMSLIPILGWELSLIGIIIPIMMIAVANDYGVHLISHYQELNATQANKKMNSIVMLSMKQLRNPIILSALTTIVGIQGLLAHLMTPARQMGVIAAIGIGIALILSLTFIPSFLSTMKKGKSHKSFDKTQNGFIGKLLAKSAIIINTHPWRMIMAFGLFILICSSGLLFFQTASDNDNVLPRKHSYNQSIAIANQHFGGTRFLSVLFTGDMKDPELLGRMNTYEKQLKQMPEIGNVSSIATVTRVMSKALNDESSANYDRIPESRNAVAQYFELYNMNGDPEDFENLVDFNYEHGLLNIQFQASDMKTLNKVIANIEQITGSDPSFEALAGYSLTDKEMADSITRGQIFSLLLALAAIFILLSIIFKSITAGLIGSIPLAFAVVCTFGIMGLLGIKLNIVTALLSSISIGVGVDYTIHLFWRLRSETALGKSLNEAIPVALSTTGRGIIINALSVIVGFSVLFFSAFPYLKMFAMLIILSIFLCLICALWLIPALCKIIQPKFLLK